MRFTRAALASTTCLACLVVSTLASPVVSLPTATSSSLSDQLLPLPRPPSPGILPVILSPRHDHHHGGEGEDDEAADEEPTLPPSTPTIVDNIVDGSGQIMEPIPTSPSGGHSHHHHGMAPLTILNETDILLSHDPNPLSYWTHDWTFAAGDERLQGRGQYGGWIVYGHAATMTIGMLFLLPLGEF